MLPEGSNGADYASYEGGEADEGWSPDYGYVRHGEQAIEQEEHSKADEENGNLPQGAELPPR